MAHNTTSDPGSALSWDSGRISAGKAYSVTFAKPGAYAYTCTLHPAPRGTVTVG